MANKYEDHYHIKIGKLLFCLKTFQTKWRLCDTAVVGTRLLLLLPRIVAVKRIVKTCHYLANNKTERLTCY